MDKTIVNKRILYDAIKTPMAKGRSSVTDFNNSVYCNYEWCFVSWTCKRTMYFRIPHVLFQQINFFLTYHSENYLL